MASKTKSKSGIKTSFTNTKGQKVVVNRDGSKTYDGKPASSSNGGGGSSGGGNTSGFSDLKSMSIALAGGMGTGGADTGTKGNTKGGGGATTGVRRYTPYEEFMEGQGGQTEFTDKDADKLRKQRYKEARGQIDSIHDVFNDKIRSAQEENLQNTGRTRAIVGRAGLTGSGRGQGMMTKTAEYNRGVIGDIENQRMEKINSIFAEIDRRADTEIEARRSEAAGRREAYGTFLKEQTEGARQQMSDLASLGVRIEEISPEDKDDFLKYTGMDEATFDLTWNKMLPKEDQTDYKFEVTDRGVLAYGINPKTGELVTKTYAMPSELAPGEELQEFGGTLYAVSRGTDGKVVMRPLVNDGTGSGAGGGAYVEGADPEVDSWVALISRGEAKLDDVPAKLKSAVAQGLAGTTSKATADKIAGLNDVLTLATELQTADGKGAAIGAGFKKNIASLIPGIDEEAIAGTARASYEAKAKQLIDTLASTNLDKLKGAMSDKDIEFLRNIGSGLKFDMKESDWDAELTKIINKVTTAISDNQKKGAPKQGQVTSSNLDVYLDSNPEADAMIQKAVAEDPNLTDEEILYLINGK